jgi:hypothetical protein
VQLHVHDDMHGHWQAQQYKPMLDVFLTVEITLHKMATHLTGATKGLVFKRKQAKRAITLPWKLAKLKNVQSTNDKVGYLKGVGSDVTSTFRLLMDLQRCKLLRTRGTPELPR